MYFQTTKLRFQNNNNKLIGNMLITNVELQLLKIKHHSFGNYTPYLELLS